MNKIWNYLFDFYAGSPNLLFWKIAMVLAGLAIIGSFVSLMFHKSSDKFVKHLNYRLAIWGLTTGPIIFLLAAFRFMNIYLLSMRVLIIVWLIFCAFWLARIAKWWILDVPKARSRRRVNQSFHKYLPR